MKKKKFTVEFKVKAVEYLENNKVTLQEAAKHLGVAVSTLSK